MAPDRTVTLPRRPARRPPEPIENEPVCTVAARRAPGHMWFREDVRTSLCGLLLHTSRGSSSLAAGAALELVSSCSRVLSSGAQSGGLASARTARALVVRRCVSWSLRWELGAFTALAADMSQCCRPGGARTCLFTAAAMGADALAAGTVQCATQNAAALVAAAARHSVVAARKQHPQPPQLDPLAARTGLVTQRSHAPPAAASDCSAAAPPWPLLPRSRSHTSPASRPCHPIDARFADATSAARHLPPLVAPAGLTIRRPAPRLRAPAALPLLEPLAVARAALVRRARRQHRLVTAMGAFTAHAVDTLQRVAREARACRWKAARRRLRLAAVSTRPL